MCFFGCFFGRKVKSIRSPLAMKALMVSMLSDELTAQR
jgi:hypothetical protein